jgi:hypothetical protein
MQLRLGQGFRRTPCFLSGAPKGERCFPDSGRDSDQAAFCVAERVQVGSNHEKTEIVEERKFGGLENGLGTKLSLSKRVELLDSHGTPFQWSFRAPHTRRVEGRNGTLP